MNTQNNTELAFAQSAGTRALVIGGSLAGLLAARVLSAYYDQVLVVERDVFPEGPENRAGTPQAFHVHRLLTRGKMILEQFFPGLVDELLAHGAFPMHGKYMRLGTRYGDSMFRLPEKEKDSSWSRALLEWTLRQRVLALPNIRFMTQQEALALQFTEGRTHVTGVRFRERGNLAHETTISADLVVDASGRTSKLSQWLRESGYEEPAAEHIKTALGYSTAYYQISPQFAENWGMIVVEGLPEKLTSAGGLIPIENNTCQALLFGAAGYYPPTNVKEFEEGFRHLVSPIIAEALQEVGAMTIQPRGFRVPECVRHHYEQMERWPSGLLVMGDALCHFDPIYGQGMSVAAIEAETLGRCLNEQRSTPRADFERHTLQRLQDVIEPAWWLSTVADLRWPGVEYSGPLSRQGFTFAQKYLDLYVKQAFQPHAGKQPNEEMLQKFMLVNALLISPRAIFNPRTIAGLLAADASNESRQLLAALPSYGPTLEAVLEKALDEFVPSFALAFDERMQAALLAPQTS